MYQLRHTYSQTTSINNLRCAQTNLKEKGDIYADSGVFNLVMFCKNAQNNKNISFISFLKMLSLFHNRCPSTVISLSCTLYNHFKYIHFLVFQTFFH